MHCISDLKNLRPTEEDIDRLFDHKYRRDYGFAWGPSLRTRYGYYTPDDWYEALVERVVGDGCEWADVGCGRDTFPGNKPLAERLARRARSVTGIDPSPNIRENPYIGARFEGTLEDYPLNEPTFDVVTMRMVAEHIEHPKRIIAKLRAICRADALVIVYTPFKWSPVSLAAHWVPFGLHHRLKQIAWHTEERDTFPVRYLMNTRADLAEAFAAGGFTEVFFAFLDDCRTTSRSLRLNRLELLARSAFAKAGWSYPERCLLAAYAPDGTWRNALPPGRSQGEQTRSITPPPAS